MAWALAVAFGTLTLLFPALWNGFALVFFDTGGYIDRVVEMSLYPGRSVFYGFFLWLASLGWWSFWGPIACKSILCLWVIHLILRCHDLPSGPMSTALACAGLSLATGISWYTSQLMPDILVAVAVLALWLLFSSWTLLGRWERCGLMATTLLALVSHNSCLALAIGLLLVMALLKIVMLRLNRTVSLRLWSPAAVVAAGLLLIPAGNWAVSGKLTYSSGGEAFLFARLVQAGIAQQWLAENCPVANVKLCAMKEKIPKTSDEFLWSRTSPFQALGDWTGREARKELEFLVEETVKEYPGWVLWSSLEATVDQFLMLETGDGLDNYQDYTRKVFSRLSPQIAEDFNAADQQRRGITQRLFDWLNRVHLPIAYGSLLGLVLVAVAGIRHRRYEMAALAGYVLVALWGNAFICGALSSPFDRYQSRLVWLATLVVGMAVAAWWPRRRRDGATPLLTPYSAAQS
jgi:hypothetical protein